MSENRGKKRKVAFAAEHEVREVEARPSKRARRGGGDDDDDGDDDDRQQGARQASDVEGMEAHTLESDDEDEDAVPKKKYQLTDEDIHEELDEKFTDGGVPLTAFNLKEEMEEGYFDENSNYVQAKDDEARADAWLEGAQIYVPPPKMETEAAEQPEQSKLQVLQELLKFMQPHESVTQTLKRLAGDRKTGRPADKAAVDAVTEALNTLLERGMFDIYQATYEKVSYDIGLMQSGSNLGMFEYKWTDEEEAEVHGPFTAQQMLEWKDQGFFGANGVLARELGKGEDTQFYNSNRIDFDLFT